MPLRCRNGTRTGSRELGVIGWAVLLRNACSLNLFFLLTRRRFRLRVFRFGVSGLPFPRAEPKAILEH